MRKRFRALAQLIICQPQFNIGRFLKGFGDLLFKGFVFGYYKVEVGFNLALNSSSPTSAAAIATTTTTLLLVDSDRLDLTLTWSQAGDYVVEDIHEDEEAEGDWELRLPGRRHQLQTPFFQK